MRRVILKMCKARFGAAFALFALTVPACVAGNLPTTSASEYHVSPDGDDAQDGSILASWRMLQRAADTLMPGETVYVHDGVYDERVTINVSGNANAGQRRVLDGDGDGVPVVDLGAFEFH